MYCLVHAIHVTAAGGVQDVLELTLEEQHNATAPSCQGVRCHSWLWTETSQPVCGFSELRPYVTVANFLLHETGLSKAV
jgi:hypothetical protein